jgi:F420-non-reducing hydrogenase iron-sulfur subunit
MNERAQRRPTVVVFHCDGGSLATPVAEPVHPGAGFIRVPCAGRISAGDVLRALRAGASGVLLAGCAPGACRFGDAVTHAQNVATDLAPVLEAMGLGAHRVRFAAAGSGAGLTEAVSTFLGRVRDEEVSRPSREEASRRSALMNVLPPYPHHGAVQEGALLSHVGRHTPPRPTWAQGATAGAKTLLYVCDLPLLGGLLGHHFPGDTHTTLGACMTLLNRAGVEVDVVPALPCCGHDFGLAGVEKERLPEARRVREALEATGARRVVTVSTECEWHLREGFDELGVALEPEVIRLEDLLFDRLETLTPAFTSHQDPGPGEQTALYVGEGSTESPSSALALLTAAGLEPVVVLPREFGKDGAQGQGEVQGSAGVKGFVHCDGASRAAQDRLLHEVEAGGASTLITVSVTAAIHLNCALRRGSWRRSGVRVVTLFDSLAARLTSTGES